jgi:tetratricopeptide (TPR) repeat protein
VSRFWLFILVSGPLICQEHSLVDGIRLLYQEHNYEKALSVFQEIVKNTPRNAEAWRCLGTASAALGRRDQAIAAYQRAIDINPNSETYVDLGIQYDAAGRVEEEIEAFKRGIQVNPGNVDAYDYMAHAYNRLGRYDEALKLAKQAIYIRPDDAEALLVLGSSYAGTGLYQPALEAIQRAVKLSPNNANAYGILGSIDQALERYQDAIDALKHAVQLEPTDAATYYRLGVAYEALSVKNGDSAARDSATAALKRAIELQPNFADAYATLGAQQHRLDHPQEAAEACGQAIRLRPDYAYAHLCLGLASLRMGRTDPAVEEYRALVGLDQSMASQLSDAISKSKALHDGKLVGEDVLWADSASGSYSFRIHNQLADAVKNLTCQVVFYDQNGSPIETDRVRHEGVIPAGLGQRVNGKVDAAIHALTTTGTLLDTTHPTTKVEVRVLDYDVVR